MSERVVHCPFLNRADARCANHFSLDRLGHAFEHCFGDYKSCKTYLELLVERRVRQSGETVLRDPLKPAEPDPQKAAHEARAFVQLRIKPPIDPCLGRYEKSAA